MVAYNRMQGRTVRAKAHLVREASHTQRGCGMSAIKRLWCDWFHGGGHVTRDATGCINWQCARCGRWADPVPLEVEAAAVGEKLRITRLISAADGKDSRTKTGE